MNIPAAQALAHTLLHSLWEGALIALLLAGILQMCRSSSARLRYALACAALFAMPIAFGVTFWLSLPAAPPHAAIAPPFPSSLRMLNPLGSLPASREPAQPALLWLVPLWMAGVVCFYVYGLAGWIATLRLRRVGVCAASDAWQERLRDLAKRIGVSPTVVLLESCLANTPVVVGVFRPLILAPLGILAGLPTNQVESILLHELAHIRRHDYLINLAQRLVEGLLFYHPAAWWISNLVRTEREFCCDDLVVELSGDPRSYAQALSTLELRRWSATQAALAANGGNLMTRIRRLLHKGEGSRITAAPLAGLLLLLACAALVAWQPTPTPAPTPQAQTQPLAPVTAPAPIVPVPQEPSASPVAPAANKRVSPYKKWMQEEVDRMVAQAQPPATPRVVPTPQPATQVPDPYQKWLDEEAVYIITNEERTAFGRLMTADERSQFIKQFWLRRDPTPDTPENEFQEELYRRIQYANDRFAGTQAGWMTDRGKAYINYGPPDQIDVNPGSPDAPPSQTWRYRHIDGVGDDVILEFVDSNRSGDYRLTLDPNRIVRGPVLIPKVYSGSQKTFFFFNFEQYRQRPELNGDTVTPAPPPAR